MHGPMPQNFSMILAGNHRSSESRSAIQDLIILIGLMEDTLDCDFHQRSVVVNGNNDRDFWKSRYGGKQQEIKPCAWIFLLARDSSDRTGRAALRAQPGISIHPFSERSPGATSFRHDGNRRPVVSHTGPSREIIEHNNAPAPVRPIRSEQPPGRIPTNIANKEK